MRGQKICSSCKKPNGPRAFFCKYCKTPYETRTTPGPIPYLKRITENEKPSDYDSFNWEMLVPGDFIVVKGGPYHLSYDEHGQEVRLPMGEKGLFKVLRLEQNGILAYPKGKKHECHGLHFIYMGEETDCAAGIIKVPHRVRKAKLKKNVVL